MLSGRPTQFASKTGVGTTGIFLYSNGDVARSRAPALVWRLLGLDYIYKSILLDIFIYIRVFIYVGLTSTPNTSFSIYACIYMYIYMYSNPSP